MADAPVDTLAPAADTAKNDTAPADVEGGDCNAIVNDAPTVKVVQVFTRFEAAAGGTIASGRYHLTRAELRSGTSGTRTFMRTIQIEGSRIFEADRDPGVTTADSRRNANIALEGTLMTETDTCTNGADFDVSKWRYTATATTLDLFDDSATPILRFHYEKK